MSKKTVAAMMTSAELADIAATVRGVFAQVANATGGRTAGNDTVCDLEDVEQEAATWIWVEHLRTGLPLQGNRGYYFAVGSRRAGRLMRTLRSEVHLTDHAMDKLGFGHEDKRVPLQDCGFGDDFWDAGGRAIGAIEVPAAPVEPLSSRDKSRARTVVLTVVANAAAEDGETLPRVMKHPPRLRSEARAKICASETAKEAFRVYISS